MEWKAKLESAYSFILKYPKITVCKQGMLRFMQYICCAAFIFPVKNYAIRCTFDRKKKEIQQIAFLFKMPKQSLQKTLLQTIINSI